MQRVKIVAHKVVPCYTFATHLGLNKPLIAYDLQEHKGILWGLLLQVAGLKLDVTVNGRLCIITWRVFSIAVVLWGWSCHFPSYILYVYFVGISSKH
jgi:hypothetical protein